MQPTPEIHPVIDEQSARAAELDSLASQIPAVTYTGRMDRLQRLCGGSPSAADIVLRQDAARELESSDSFRRGLVDFLASYRSDEMYVNDFLEPGTIGTTRYTYERTKRSLGHAARFIEGIDSGKIDAPDSEVLTHAVDSIVTFLESDEGVMAGGPVYWTRDGLRGRQDSERFKRIRRRPGISPYAAGGGALGSGSSILGAFELSSMGPAGTAAATALVVLPQTPNPKPQTPSLCSLKIKLNSIIS